ncbi:MAG TPA: hypothetical protein VE998_00950 [Terriglobales bacterium]|nr:hypothetical protein [Terriglobales bacterium]
MSCQGIKAHSGNQDFNPASNVVMLMTTLLPAPCPHCQARRGIAEFDDSGETYTLKCGGCNSDLTLPSPQLPDQAAA